MPARNRPRTFALARRTAVAILLGVAATFACAWFFVGTAKFSALTTVAQTSIALPHGDAYVFLQEARGISRIDIVFAPIINPQAPTPWKPIRGHHRGAFDDALIRRLVDAYAPEPLFPPTGDKQAFCDAVRSQAIERAGWPWLALEARFTDPDWTTRTQLSALPLRPIWPGFAINTALNAAAAWLIVIIPGAVLRAIRRRRAARIGRCPNCGYDRRGLPSSTTPCPECGYPQRMPADDGVDTHPLTRTGGAIRHTLARRAATCPRCGHDRHNLAPAAPCPECDGPAAASPPPQTP